MPENSIPRYGAGRGSDSRAEVMNEWANALLKHPHLAADLLQCRDALRAELPTAHQVRCAWSTIAKATGREISLGLALAKSALDDEEASIQALHAILPDAPIWDIRAFIVATL